MKQFLFLLLTFVCIEAYAQHYAFTRHPMGNPVKCYDNMNMKEVRYKIYPLKEESNAGAIVQLLHSKDNYIAINVNGEITYVKQGYLAVNTRNYNGKTLCLYDQPNYDSEVVYKTTQEHTVTIYNIWNGWLYVCINEKNRDKVYGWIEPDMQCPNPFTSCP